jgi:hypothetical protein
MHDGPGKERDSILVSESLSRSAHFVIPPTSGHLRADTPAAPPLGKAQPGGRKTGASINP